MTNILPTDAKKNRHAPALGHESKSIAAGQHHIGIHKILTIVKHKHPTTTLSTPTMVGVG